MVVIGRSETVAGQPGVMLEGVTPLSPRAIRRAIRSRSARRYGLLLDRARALVGSGGKEALAQVGQGEAAGTHVNIQQSHVGNP